MTQRGCASTFGAARGGRSVTIYYVRYRLREDLPGHWRRQGPFEDRPSAEDFARLLEREMQDLEEVKVVAEDEGHACT